MRHFYFFLFISLFFAKGISQENLKKETIHTGIEAHKIVSGSELIRMYAYTSIPAYIKFRGYSSIPESKIENWLIKLMKMGNAGGVKFVKKEIDELGITHYRFLQTYKGYEIFGSGYLVHCKNGLVISANGLMYDHVSINESKIEEKQALSLALKKVSASAYKWELPEEEKQASHDFEEGIRKSPTYFPKGELKIIPKNGDFYTAIHSFRLAYVFDIYSHEPMDRKEFFVDAENGNILFENPLIMHGNANGTALTVYSGTRPIITDSTSPINFRLRELGRGNGIQTYNLNKGTNYGTATDFIDSNNIWNNVNANKDEYATDAHWGSEMTYDYFWLKHGRNSIDNAGFLLKSYIHYSTNYTNAFWNGSYMTYGDGASPYNPLVAMDIAGHEISHGLTSNTSNLVYSNESGALNESFSDIFGVAIDFYARPTLANYLMGDGIGGTPFRNMANPNQYGDPDTYLGTNWYSGTADNGGVHTNSGVQNYWFYLMINGGIGKNDKNDSFWVNRLGIDTAGKIAFRNNTYYLISSSQYADARFYAIQSAMDLYGPCSKAVISTTNAWHAVGVGARFDSSITANFIAINPTACAAPQTIRFVNLSNNGFSFKWKFGNGDSSSVMNPSYKYNSNGVYTISLIADGGLCGIDTFIRVNYISVDPHNDCVAYMGDTLNNQCFGTLYDEGGPNSNYATDDSLVFTVSPTSASSIVFTKVDFDVEAGTSSGVCDYDYVQFYNGSSITSSLLGKYCNTNVPPATISTGASGTVKLISDPAVTGRGFEFKWQCTIPNAKPSVRFSSSTLNTCTGIVSFKDESYNTPTSWAWSFGDGGTSTLKNPTYIYNTSGVYNVRLIATNAFGSDTFTKLSYITVSRLNSPTVATPNIKRCNAGTVSFNASSPNTIQWFDSLTSTTPINTGTIFTTPSLSATRNYYVQSTSITPTKNLGPVDTSIGAGGYHTAIPPAYMIFDATKPCKLVSVKVRANSTKSRRIQLSDRFGTILKDTIIAISAGTQTVNLGFDIPMGLNLRLGIHKDSSAGLYRNTAGTSYPYTDASGIITIKGHNFSSTAPSNYYYFYNWVIKEEDCTSPRVAVTATIQNPIVLKNLDTFNCNGSPITLTPTANHIDSIYWTTGLISASSRTVAPVINSDYIYTAFNVCGAFRDTATITALKIPTLTTSNDTTICTGQSVRMRAYSNVNINWNTIPSTDTMPIVSPNSTTLYPCIASNQCGVARDTTKVIVVNTTTVVAGNDTTLCKGDSIILSASSSLPITWFPMNKSGNSIKVSPNSSTYFYAEVNSSCGISRDTVYVNVVNKPILTTSNDTSICAGQSVKLKANSNYNVLWSSLGINDTIVTVSPVSNTNYPILVSSICGVLRDTIQVMVESVPSLTASNDTTICEGDSTALKAVSSLPIVWYPMGVTASNYKVAPKFSTFYYAQVSNACGTKRDTVVISILSKSDIILNNDTTICNGNSVKLKAKTGSSLLWLINNSSDTMIVVSPSNTTKYVIQATSICGLYRDSVYVVVIDKPTLVANDDTTICFGKILKLTATTNGSLAWTNPVSNLSQVTVTPTSSSIYTLKSSNNCGTVYDTIRVLVTPLPKANSTKIITGKSVQFTNTSTNAITYKWIFGDNTTSTATSPSKVYSASGTYDVMQIATNACGSDTLKLKLIINSSFIGSIEPEFISIYPNPTKDILTIDYPNSSIESTISIYDMLGRKLLEQRVSNKDQYKIDLSAYSEGTYHLRINVNNQQIINKKIEVIK